MGSIIYLLSVIDKLIDFWVAGLSVMGMASLGLLIYYLVNMADDCVDVANSILPYLKYVIICFIIFLILNIFTPSSKTIATMYLFPKIVNNEQVQEIPGKALDMLNLKMDEYIESMLPSKKEK